MTNRDKDRDDERPTKRAPRGSGNRHPSGRRSDRDEDGDNQDDQDEQNDQEDDSSPRQGHAHRHSDKESEDEKGEIIHRYEDQYEDEIAEDPERVMYKLRASRKVVLAGFLSTLLLGALPGYFAWHALHEKTFFIYSHRWMLNVLMFMPVTLAAIFGAKSALVLLTKRFAISRRYIRSQTWLGVDIVDSCDMTLVLDMQLTRLGPVSNISIVTSDKTTPKINMKLIPTALANEVFGYLTSHAQHSYIELRRSRRYNRGT